MRLFILLSRVPYPLEKGDKLRAFNHIKYLSEDNEIILCALNAQKLHKDALKNLEKYCKSVNIINISVFSLFLNLVRALFTIRPFQVEYFYTKKAKRKIDNLIKEYKPEHIFCQLIRVTEYVKDYKIRKTLDYQDVFSTNIERRMNASPFYLKWLLKIENKRLLKYENDIYEDFDNRIIISAADRALIPHKKKNNIHVIPNGVDTDYFQQSAISIKRKYDLLFTGNMGYFPNVISAIYLVKKILPEAKKYNPNIKVLIAGANPDKKVLALASENVVISGWVEDIRDCYSNSKILIAPMQLGTGLQNKLLEAMAMELPCITSPLANNALGAENGKEIISCSTPEEYAKNIKMLLENEATYNKIANNGHNYVLAQFNWQKIVKQLNTIISSQQ
jgi:polysaccharide biosynthesis protein PslH